MVITATTAPSSITVDNVTTLSAKTGTQHTLAWSGAAAGTNNAITGYQILYSTAPSTGFTELADVAANVSSYTVTAPVDANVTYYYRIITKGTYLDSGQSDYCSMTSYAIGQTSTPSNVRLSVTVAIPGTAVTLSWEKSTPGLNATITGYAVYRSTAAATGYTVLGTVDENTASMTVMPAEAEGGTYYFKVKAVCDDSDADSALSDYAALHTNISPTAPVVQSGSVSHCSRPRIMLTVGTDPEGELMTMSANGYTPSRSSGIASGDHILLRRNNARTSAGKDTFDITITDPNGGTVTQAAEVRYTPIVWTDEVVEAGTTIIKAAHITELQAAIDDMCSYYNVTARTWTPCVAGSTSTLMWYTHVAEIIQAIQVIADAVNAWDANTTVNNVGLPTLEPTLMPTADAIMQMRAAVALL